VGELRADDRRHIDRERLRLEHVLLRIAVGAAVLEVDRDRQDHVVARRGRLERVLLLQDPPSVLRLGQRVAEVADREAGEGVAERRLVDGDALRRVDHERELRQVGEARRAGLELDPRLHRAELGEPARRLLAAGEEGEGGERERERRVHRRCSRRRNSASSPFPNASRIGSRPPWPWRAGSGRSSGRRSTPARRQTCSMRLASAAKRSRSQARTRALPVSSSIRAPLSRSSNVTRPWSPSSRSRRSRTRTAIRSWRLAVAASVRTRGPAAAAVGGEVPPARSSGRKSLKRKTTLRRFWTLFSVSSAAARFVVPLDASSERSSRTRRSTAPFPLRAGKKSRAASAKVSSPTLSWFLSALNISIAAHFAMATRRGSRPDPNALEAETSTAKRTVSSRSSR